MRVVLAAFLLTACDIAVQPGAGNLKFEAESCTNCKLELTVTDPAPTIRPVEDRKDTP